MVEFLMAVLDLEKDGRRRGIRSGLTTPPSLRRQIGQRA
jgi:hypothetical protein